MFQNVWVNRSEIKEMISTLTIFPDNHITPEQIEYVRTIYWDEHCLECSAPACYSTCPIYSKRPDGACRRFNYGIFVRRPFNNTLWRTRLKFRKWAKIEARINKGSISVGELQRMDNRDRIFSNAFKIISRIAGYKYIRRWDGLRRKKYAEIKPSAQFVSDFLWQCNYFGDKPFILFFEITDKDNNVIFKTGLYTNPGYNQELIKIEFPLPEGGLVRIYPENNLNPELEIYSADFISLKKSIPKTPAKKVKCIAWDLDNTIWDGILAESDPSNLKIRPGVIETIKEFDKKGIIQIVVSKNDRDAVEPVLKRLGIFDYFVYIFANWNPKSENIFYASKILNIGIDTFCLIDDSQYERAEVNDSLPSVRVYDENQLISLLSHSEFDVPVTKDSPKRRLSYQQEASRKKIRESFSGQNYNFLRNCRIEATLEHINTPEQRKRSIELLLRTNQLNLSAHRYTESEFDSLLAKQNTHSLVMNVKDRFGDYGLVAFIHFEVRDKIVITEYAMSCRVASKLIENALFYHLREIYGKNKDIVVIGTRTKRNITLVDALIKTGFEGVNSKSSKIELRLKSGKDIVNYDLMSLIIK